MLAGYLPFDDDPANPDGDNINLLYKYIVTTSLTFPEYVTPHARDLLRRILVPDPRKRADLFEVARHSWLSEYSHIVSHITSSTTKVSDVARTTVPLGKYSVTLHDRRKKLFFSTMLMCPLEQGPESSVLRRSASVREAPKTYQSGVPAIGGLSHQQGDIQDRAAEKSSKTSREAKRRTVQLEYVPPQSQTARGDSPLSSAPTSSGRAALADTQARVPRHGETQYKEAVPTSSQGTATPESRTRSMSEAAAIAATTAIPSAASHREGARPATGGSMASFNRLSASYGQPVAPKMEPTNAQGRLAQPSTSQEPTTIQQSYYGRASTQQRPLDLGVSGHREMPKGHRRSSTVSSIGEKLFGRPVARFNSNRVPQSNGSRSRPSRRYPPVSGMKEGSDPRFSVDDRRSFQISRPSESSGTPGRSRRLSFFSSAFPFRPFGGTSSSIRSATPDQEGQMTPPPGGSRAQQQLYMSGQPQSRPHTTANSHYYQPTTRETATPREGEDVASSSQGGGLGPIYRNIDEHFAELHASEPSPNEQSMYGRGSIDQSGRLRPEEWEQLSGPRYGSRNYYDEQQNVAAPRQSVQTGRPSMQTGRPGRGVALQHHRKFTDAYEHERTGAQYPGSSGAARKVMDFFRRRAKSRAGEDE